jgi:hypothetical protein
VNTGFNPFPAGPFWINGIGILPENLLFLVNLQTLLEKYYIGA